MDADALRTPGLIQAAKKLQNTRLVRLFESFLEYRGCITRVIVQGVVTLWTYVWLFGPQPVLVREAQAVLPFAAALWGISIIWMVLVRTRLVPNSEWLDAAGFAFNLIIVGVQTKYAFILLISLNAFLPFITIVAVARYGARAMWPATLASLTLLIITAPDGYWLNRPAYFVYAVALTIVLPLMVSRILVATQEIAFQALASRDAQSRFISTMSHELRTPLNAVINCAQLIDDDDLSPESVTLMRSVATNASALRHRVDEVLDMASIDGDRLQLVSKALSMVDVVNTVHAVCATTASSKGVTMELSGDLDPGLSVDGDEGRIEQVITNLVSNAIKFTPSGGHVRLHLEEVPDGEVVNYRVEVSDTGIGIPDSHKGRIFAAFTQVSSGSSRTEGGVGLGLYIAKSVSDEMGGTLTVHDNPGGGTVFRWMFTVQRSQTQLVRMSVNAMLQKHRASCKPMSCLVFEDMDANRLVIRSLLERAGHQVTFLHDGRDAVDHIRSIAPDIVFLDLHMPGISGWDALAAAAGEMASLPPIIIMTADTRIASMREAEAIGVAGYLAKPIKASDLLAALEEHGEPVDVA